MPLTRSGSRNAAKAAASIAENARALRSKRAAVSDAGGAAAAKRRKPLGNISNANKNGARKRAPSRRKSAKSRASASAAALMQQLVPHMEKEAPLPSGVRDIDAGEEDDPTLVSCYARPVYKHLMEVEQKYRPDPQYMTHQNDINANMRGILVDWLVEVSEEYKLHTETLFLSINYIDRFLSRNNVQRGKLQLVGITCMLVAAKYEEIYPPSVEDFVYISDNAYSREQVIAEEVKLLNALKFHCTVATSRQFLRRFAKAARADHTTHEMAHYLAELSLLDINFVKFPPSVIAAASILIAINTTRLFGSGNLNWDATMQYYTTYSFEDLEPCANALLTAGKSSYNGSTQFRAVKEKYSQSKFDMVANRRLCDSLSK